MSRVTKVGLETWILCIPNRRISCSRDDLDSEIPWERNTEAEKKDIKEGRIPQDWKRKPAKLRQKDRDARWRVKFSKAKPTEDGAKRVDLAIPAFDYKNPCRHRPRPRADSGHGLRRPPPATTAPNCRTSSTRTTPPATSGRTRPIDPRRTNSTWPYNGLRSQIHRKKPQGKPMPEANGKKSKVRAYLEHVFARQKGPMDLVIRTIGLARATVKIGLANLTYNMKRAIWLSARTASA
jgi:transposase, IS5 family